MAEEVVDALLLAARFDDQGLTVSERSVINSLERVSAAMTRLGASGQVAPFGDLSRDIVLASKALRNGEISVAQFNEALQFSRIQLIELRKAGYEPNAKQLDLLNAAIDRTTSSLARQSSAAARASGAVVSSGEQLGKVARGADSAAAGLSRARSGLAQMAVTALGTSAAVGQVTTGLLFLGGASTGGVIAAAVAIAALAKGYEVMTSKTREATEQRNRLNTALKERISGGASEATSISREIAATEEKRALIQREINKIQEEENQLLKDPMFSLGNQIRLRKLIGELSEAQRKRDEGIALLAKLNAAAGLQATLQTLAAVDRTRHAVEASRAAASDALSQIAAQKPQTFGAEPGVISQQELRAFEERKRLAEAFNAAELKSLAIQKAAAQVKPPGFESDAEALARQTKVIEINEAIKARRIEGREQVKAIDRERDLLTATRDRALAEQAIANAASARIAAFGANAGNRTGANPLLALPGEDEIKRLASQLAAIPPIGLPLAEQIVAQFEEARRRNIAPILQGRVQQGLEPNTSPELVGHAGDFAEAVKQIKEARRQTKLWEAALKAARTPAEQIADSLTDVGGVASALSRVGQSLGFIGDQAAKSLDQVAGLANALADVVASASTGNILGAAVAGAGFIDSLGPSALSQEHDRLILENSKALGELKLSLDRSNLAGAGAAKTQDAIAKAFAIDAAARQQSGGALDPTESVERAAAAAGLSLEQFDAQIRDMTGIEILDSEGQVVGKAFRQAAEAMDVFIQKITHFSETAAGIEARISTEEKLGLTARSGNPEVAALQHDRDVQLESLQLSDAEEARIRAIDLTTAKGRAEFLDEERRLFQKAKNGELTPEELGAFGNVDELGQSIGDAADDINAFDDAVSSATKSLLNMPDTFKLAEAEFEARAKDVLPTPAPSPTLRGAPDPRFQVPGTTAGSPTTSVTGNTIQIIVQGAKGMSEGDLARRVADELEVRAIGTFGLAPPP